MTIPDRICLRLGFGILVLGLGGCVIFPVPLDDSVEARRDTVGMSMTSFTPGITTRQDVVLELGAPDKVTFDERKLVYDAPQWVVAAVGIIPADYTAKPFAVSHAGIDYFVAEFDARGVLVAFEAKEECPVLIPALTRYQGSKVLLQKHTKCRMGNHRESTYTLDEGTILLTEVELVFLSDNSYVNTSPDLRLAYSSIIETKIIGPGGGPRLLVRTRSGDKHVFQIFSGSFWHISTAVREAHELIQSRITP